MTAPDQVQRYRIVARGESLLLAGVADGLQIDSLDTAADDGVPADIIAMAAAGLGESRILWRDI
jgi:hypothetical protein